MTFKLYNYFRSSTSYRVRIALEFKSIKYEYCPIHLLNNGGEQHQTSYRDMNPAGEVPTLDHNGKIIGQSFAIIQYLENLFPEPALFPKDSYLKAIAQQICENFNCMHPYQNLKTMQYMEKELKISPEQKQKWLQHWITKNLIETEKLIEKHAGTFCVGNEVTAADLFLVPQLFSADRFQIDIKQFKTLSAINTRCLELPFFIKAHPKNQIDFQS